MITLPIPLVVALILGFLLLRSLMEDRRFTLFSALLAAAAGQAVLMTLVQYYGLESLRLLQPICATAIPPLAWVAFQTSAIRDLDPARDWRHMAAPILTAVCVVALPSALDVVVAGAFAFYGGLILRALRRGPDALPRLRLEDGPTPTRIWAAIGAAMIASAFSDLMILAAALAGADWLRPWIISLFSSLWLLAIGALSLSNSLKGEGDPAREAEAEAKPPPDRAEPSDEDASLIAALDRLLTEERLYLDSDLTLARLARRLRVPAKKLSAAVNRVTGENVSRHINAYRIRQACARLQAGDNVTTAMLASGFITKSNFNREFLRVVGVAPSAWIADNQA